MPRQRIRIRHTKQDRLKFIGHNDLLRTLETLFRRARLPLAMSSGYHPKVRMSFPGALPLGFESTDEVLELEFLESAEPLNTDALLAELNRQSLKGLNFLSARYLQEGEKKVRLVSSVYQMVVPVELRERAAQQIELFLKESSVIITKFKGKQVDVRSAVTHLSLEKTSGKLTVELQTQTGPEAGVKEMLKALDLEKELFVTLFPKRICSRLVDEE